MNSGKSIVIMIISLVTLGLVLFILFQQTGGRVESDYTTEKKLAGELLDNNLYQAAIEEYATILGDVNIDAGTEANVNYLMGRIYFDKLFDYEKAAACFVRARALNPEGSFYDEAGRNLVTCFEKMGRMVDAKRELDKAVNLDSVYAGHEGEKPVAKIGDRPVFMSELNDEIQTYPPELQKKYLTREGKAEFLNQYVSLELMYRAALREGFDTDPEILADRERLGKQLIIEKYMIEKVMPQTDIDSTDIYNYYVANKDARYSGKAYDDIKTQVFVDYQQEKAQKAFSEYVEKLSAIENVKIFEENLK